MEKFGQCEQKQIVLVCVPKGYIWSLSGKSLFFVDRQMKEALQCDCCV